MLSNIFPEDLTWLQSVSGSGTLQSGSLEVHKARGSSGCRQSGRASPIRSHAHQRDLEALPCAFGEFQEISLPFASRVLQNTHHRGRFIRSTQNFDEIHGFLLEHRQNFQVIFLRASAFLEIRTVQLHRNGETGAAGLTDGVDSLLRQTHPVFDGAAVAIRAAVDFGIQEFGEEVAMRSMELDPVCKGSIKYPVTRQLNQRNTIHENETLK